MKIRLVAISALVLLMVPSSLQAAAIEIWWPNEGAHLTGTQPLKAIQKGSVVDDYDMYWQVDGGALTAMNTSEENYAHKESMVDFSHWNWNGAGPYRLTFKTKSKVGGDSGETSMNVYVDSDLKKSSTAQPVVSQSMPKEVSSNISVWWPTDKTHIKDSVPLKALLDSKKISDYSLFWQVDGGRENVMLDSEIEYPHKEVIVDVSDWNWNGTGPYEFTFVARSNDSGAVIGKTKRSVYIDKSVVDKKVTSTVMTPVKISSNPLAGKKLYVDTTSPAATQASAWSQSRPNDAALMKKIANNPHPIWLGSWSSDSATTEKILSTITSADAVGAVPTFVLYNIPLRDCGSYSAGGTSDSLTYELWIDMVAKALGRSPAIVILEPDALSQIDCLSEAGQAARLSLLKNAVTVLKTKTAAVVYIDAGHSGWISARDMSDRLKKVAVDRADGFSLNVSNFDSTGVSTTFGKEISAQINNKHFVIDTSRNGLGSNGEWCNPGGRALGQAPTTNTGEPMADAYLWLKVPGESDGSCNGGLSAGSWWADYALGLSARANW